MVALVGWGSRCIKNDSFCYVRVTRIVSTAMLRPVLSRNGIFCNVEAVNTSVYGTSKQCFVGVLSYSGEVQRLTPATVLRLLKTEAVLRLLWGGL